AACNCYTCRTFSRAYLRHLFVTEELLAYRLLTLHNVHFYLSLMAAMRDAIAARAFAAFRARILRGYRVSSRTYEPLLPRRRLGDGARAGRRRRRQLAADAHAGDVRGDVRDLLFPDDPAAAEAEAGP